LPLARSAHSTLHSAVRAPHAPLQLDIGRSELAGLAIKLGKDLDLARRTAGTTGPARNRRRPSRSAHAIDVVHLHGEMKMMAVR